MEQQAQNEKVEIQPPEIPQPAPQKPLEGFTLEELATIHTLAKRSLNECLAAAARKRDAGRGTASVDDMTYADELQTIINKASMMELMTL